MHFTRYKNHLRLENLHLPPPLLHRTFEYYYEFGEFKIELKAQVGFRKWLIVSDKWRISTGLCIYPSQPSSFSEILDISPEAAIMPIKGTLFNFGIFRK
jgi:hypothetical protein